MEEIHVSLRCWCQRKVSKTTYFLHCFLMHHFNYWNLHFVSIVDKQRKRQRQQIRKWKPCKVKDILVNLQSYFEQYNAYHSLSTWISRAWEDFKEDFRANWYIILGHHPSFCSITTMYTIWRSNWTHHLPFILFSIWRKNAFQFSWEKYAKHKHENTTMHENVLKLGHCFFYDQVIFAIDCWMFTEDAAY